MLYTDSASIRFDARRETKTEPNRFRANVDLPAATFSKSDKVLLFKGGKDARSSIYDFGPLISTKINGRNFTNLTVKLLSISVTSLARHILVACHKHSNENKSLFDKTIDKPKYRSNIQQTL